MKNTQLASATPRRLRRRLTSALLILSLTVGTIASTATPVEAASYVVGCFKPYWSGMTVVTLPVELQATNTPWDESSWVRVTSNTIYGPSQCLAWTIQPGVAARGWYLRMKINNYRTYTGTYWGLSQLMALPGDGQANLGTALIYCQGTC